MSGPLSQETQQLVAQVLDYLLDDFLEEQRETPFYHNTHQCHLDGSIEELSDFRGRIKSIEDGGLYCYIGGRIKALEELKEQLIKNRSDF